MEISARQTRRDHRLEWQDHDDFSRRAHFGDGQHSYADRRQHWTPLLALGRNFDGFIVTVAEISSFQFETIEHSGLKSACC